MSDNENTIKRPTIGFVGLGLMGSAMVERLQELKYEVRVLANNSRTNIEAAVKRGAVEVFSGFELATESAIVMICVNTSETVEKLIYGSNGIKKGVKKGSIIIDFGTSKPLSTKNIANDLKNIGVGFVDAPLGRTPFFARKGKLNIMGAGQKDDFNNVKPILDDLGENVFYIGPSGSGHSLKLINNFMSMTTASAMSQAFAVGDLAEIPRETLYKILAAGPLHSGMMDFIKEQAIAGNIKLEFAVKNGLKDVSYFDDMINDLGFKSHISFATKETLIAANADGWGDKMVPELVDYFSKSSDK
ncbi:MAG: NAD(P)-dependent oxidoreductase [Paracoccaceae bacterium]|nr:NAD(P)-dependent oxidoreductase [Paracoccaceae bacterium]